MLLALSLLVAAPLATSQGPWLEMQAGPMLLRESGRPGLGKGPLVRFDLGLASTERTAAELWVQGALENAPLSTPGDRALLGGGVAGRLRLYAFSDKLALWGRAGAGWLTGESLSGPAGFAGAALMFRPFVQRFTLGLEADALAGRHAVGFALLPSLRCSL